VKVWQLEDGFGLDNLRLGETETPSPGPGEVLVRLTAASLNYRDLMVVNGQYGIEQPLPLVPLSDGAGIVESVGKAVTAFQPGDRVTACFHQAWPAGAASRDRLSQALGAGAVQGVAAEYRVFAEHGLVPSPAGLDDRAAAALPCAGVTAWSAVVGELRAEPGETVLVQGSGGVAGFALQFAKAMGCQVVALSSSEAKCKRLRALGADETINYADAPDWARAAVKATGGRGVDHVVDVGGPDTLEQSLRALRVGGRIAVIGVLSGIKTEITLPLMFLHHARLQGMTVGNRDAHLAMPRFIEQRAIQPVLDASAFGFSELPAALEHMAARRHFGKICLDLAR